MISVSAPIVEDPEVGILMKDRDLKGGEVDPARNPYTKTHTCGCSRFSGRIGTGAARRKRSCRILIIKERKRLKREKT